MFTSYYFLFYSILMFLIGILAAGAFRHRKAPAARTFFTMVITVIFILLSLEMCHITSKERAWLFWVNLRFSSVLAFNISWLMFVLKKTDYYSKLDYRLKFTPALGALILVLLSATNSFHGLFYKNIRVINGQLQYTRGFLDKVGPLYASLIMLTGIILLLFKYLSTGGLRKNQLGVLMFGMIPPWFGYVFYRFYPHPVTKMILPLTILITCIAYYWAVFELHMFDVIKYAYASVAGKMKDGIILLDTDNKILDINPGARDMLNINQSEAVNRDLEKLLGEYPDTVAFIKENKGSNNIFVPEEEDFEIRKKPLKNNKGKLITNIIIFHDISERKEYQSRLLQKERTLAVMEERERIARELHDDLCQVIGYIKTQSESIKGCLVNNRIEKAGDQLDRLIEVVRQANTELRESIDSLKRELKEDRNFVDSLNKYLKEYCSLHKYKINERQYNNISFLKVLPEFTGNQLLKIIQEALTNIHKHAAAGSIIIKFDLCENGLKFLIKDNGAGFDSNLLQEGKRGGFGLKIMQERAAALGGTISIASRRGKGTEVSGQIPLPEAGVKAGHLMKIKLTEG